MHTFRGLTIFVRRVTKIVMIAWVDIWDRLIKVALQAVISYLLLRKGRQMAKKKDPQSLKRDIERLKLEIELEELKRKKEKVKK